MSNNPGINSKPFNLNLPKEWFQKNDILTTSDNINVVVISTPKNVWWRTLLYYMSFKLIDIRRIYYKVKQINHE